VADPRRASIGAVWLGYSTLFERPRSAETAVFPISSVRFPQRFTCDVLDPPPSAGRYAAADGTLLPGELRLARLFLFDDADRDGRFALDDEGRLAAPDLLLARAERHALVYVARLPAPDEHVAAVPIVANWAAAHPGYHVLALEPTPPLRGQIVPRATPVEFSSPPGPELY
jgi:hypothetical protein